MEAKVLSTKSDKLIVHKLALHQDLEAVCSDVLRLPLLSVKLQGYHNLFTRSFSFSEASKYFTEPPKLKLENALLNLINFDVSDLLYFKTTCELSVPICTTYLEECRIDDSHEKPDAIFLHKFLPTFVKFPSTARRELYLQNASKNCVKGSIDVLAGTLANGNKPCLEIKDGTQLMNIYLGSCAEAKSPRVRSRTKADEDLKMVYQPITEVCAVSELCTFGCKEVPLLNLLGSQHTIRPFLYFKHYDVLLTTETPVTYKDGSGNVDLYGLLLLKLLFMLDKYPFHKKCLETIEKTGWKTVVNQMHIPMSR